MWSSGATFLTNICCFIFIMPTIWFFIKITTKLILLNHLTKWNYAVCRLIAFQILTIFEGILYFRYLMKEKYYRMLIWWKFFVGRPLKAFLPSLYLFHNNCAEILILGRCKISYGLSGFYRCLYSWYSEWVFSRLPYFKTVIINPQWWNVAHVYTLTKGQRRSKKT